MKTYVWYDTLKKPSFAPPAWLFGPVWTLLYILIAVSFGYVTYQVWLGNIPRIVLVPLALNLLFNALFTPIQFGLRNLWLATVDIFLVLGTLILSILVIFPYVEWASLINIPYLLWVSFATILQCTVTYMNWGAK